MQLLHRARRRRVPEWGAAQVEALRKLRRAVVLVAVLAAMMARTSSESSPTGGDDLAALVRTAGLQSIF
eukprot:CAMPEP_0174241968 /NCGR_PEP_ID=MMETSP0417-20130205/25810_1 /TAXON_ID=242541 /ORGANISM="Mayorella sp, Strain BSH-02190019" /LENGTH=68 /DNA_ID=CAMNT_0015321305 /DNA_START=417 /DNA_END=624 /DNA_ORIENTATION=+